MNSLSKLEVIAEYGYRKDPFRGVHMETSDLVKVRDRVMQGQTFRDIGEAMGRSAASVRNAVNRMIEVGILQPLRVAQAVTGRTRRTVLGYGRKYYKDTRQLGLFDNEVLP